MTMDGGVFMVPDDRRVMTLRHCSVLGCRTGVYGGLICKAVSFSCSTCVDDV